jgi:hypothetical protein
MDKSTISEDGFATVYDHVVREFLKMGKIEELPKYIKERM